MDCLPTGRRASSVWPAMGIFPFVHLLAMTVAPEHLFLRSPDQKFLELRGIELAHALMVKKYLPAGANNQGSGNRLAL